MPQTLLTTNHREHRKYLVRNTTLSLDLFPLRSPLLGESLLLSFPALSNMLKFSA